ncbi:MAG: hypothetical protein STHCBS139747_006217 [Sporothrix thermara]
MPMQKSILITGCSFGGIGDALAREFRCRGLQVFVTARSTAKMTELADLGITTLEMDVTDVASASYNASKAALLAFGNTMRIELAPLCVRVVTIVTGGVESNFYNNADQRCHLPEGSLYAPLEVNIEKFDFVASVKWTQAPDYARQVASDLLRPKPKMVLWRASMSTFAWIIDSFGWTGMLLKPPLAE